MLFWIAVLAARTILFDEERALEGDAFALAAIGIGAVLFSRWLFGIVDRREEQIRRQSEQLRALHQAALTLTTELDLGIVLQRVVDLSRALTQARYGALGVLDEGGERIDQFITSGMTPEERARLGRLPEGHGILGVLIQDAKPLRLPEIGRDPRSVGFPPNHPPMHSFLGVPIISKGRVFGNLYLTDKRADADDAASPYTEFSQQDQDVLEMFATQAAIAIENAQLYRQAQQLTLLKERERFGMDLHDGIIQSIYAIGLMLEDAQLRTDEEPRQSRESIGRAIHGLNDVIRDIRNYILELRPQRFQGRDLRRGLEELARDLRANSFLTINTNFAGGDFSSLSLEQTVEILHIAQEALTNVRKHAHATSVDVSVAATDGHLELSVEDDGQGIAPGRLEGGEGYGLRNVRERAGNLGGTAHWEAREPRGTRLTLRVPLTSP
jgi:signal transduction histidine kinase